MVTVTMACGCRIHWNEKSDPHCDEHDEGRVQSVTAPPPRIVGSVGVTGPYVTQRS